MKEFVITQHPTAETRDAFWTMLWDHNAQTVVLLTPLTQTTAVFWPVKHEEYDLDYFKVVIKLQSNAIQSVCDENQNYRYQFLWIPNLILF